MNETIINQDDNKPIINQDDNVEKIMNQDDNAEQIINQDDNAGKIINQDDGAEKCQFHLALWSGVGGRGGCWPAMYCRTLPPC